MSELYNTTEPPKCAVFVGEYCIVAQYCPVSAPTSAPGCACTGARVAGQCVVVAVSCRHQHPCVHAVRCGGWRATSHPAPSRIPAGEAPSALSPSPPTRMSTSTKRCPLGTGRHCPLATGAGVWAHSETLCVVSCAVACALCTISDSTSCVSRWTGSLGALAPAVGCFVIRRERLCAWRKTHSHTGSLRACLKT